MSEKYAFIAAEYAACQAADVADAPTVETMCRWLSVSKSGYYEWKGRPVSATPSAATSGAPPTFRTADQIRSGSEMEDSRGKETSELLA